MWFKNESFRIKIPQGEGVEVWRSRRVEEPSEKPDDPNSFVSIIWCYNISTHFLAMVAFEKAAR